MNLKTCRTWPWPPMDEDMRAKIEKKLNQDSYSIYLILGAVIMVCQLAMIIVFLFRKGGPFLSPRRSAYFYSYILLFSATGLMIGLRVFAQRRGYLRFGSSLNFIYLACLCIWSTAITLYDQLGGNSLAVFTYMTLTAAVFGMLKLWQSLLLFGGNFVLLNCMLPYFPTPSGADQTFNNLTNSFFITLFAVMISVIFYRNRILAEHKRLIIEQQYREIESMNQILSEEVMTDKLTGVYNRRYMDEQLAAMMCRAEESGSAACMMIDIDHFKRYNDTYGHQSGDQCLIAFSALLTEAVREMDASVIRYGGEEFLIFIFGETADVAMRKALEIQDAVRQSRYPGDTELKGHITVSIGLYCGSAQDDTAMKEYISKADQALYNAKRTGRNRVVEYQ